jgi:biopolymer transport protein TolQ
VTPSPETHSLVDLLWGSGPVVLGVLYSLIATSVAAWGVIFFKARQMAAAKAGSQAFLDMFWDTRSLAEVARRAQNLPSSPTGEVFAAGYEELLRLHNKKKSAEGLTTELTGVANVERAMRRAASLERTELEKMLTFLATAASTTPFVGLFGTVWGIMNSFVGLSAGGPSSIQAVAPGISEALIATAAGLAAAIPALVAFNYFSRRARLLGSDMDHFISDFLNIAERHFMG